MSQQLISRSSDLRKLRDEGYDVEIRSGYLLIKDVPYVNAKKEVKFGILVSELTLAGMGAASNWLRISQSSIRFRVSQPAAAATKITTRR